MTENKNFYRASAEDFAKIPGSPVAYWVSENVINAFTDNSNIKTLSHSFQGIITGNNEFFLRLWHEISSSSITNTFSTYKDSEGIKTWVPYSKGGNYRKWYGNNEHLLRWNGYGDNLTRGRTENRHHFFKEGITWSDIAAGKPAFRYQPKSTLFDAKSPSSFYEHVGFKNILAMLNTKFIEKLVPLLNPTMSFQIDDYNKIPVKNVFLSSIQVSDIANRTVYLSKTDWDSFETSWDFTTLPLLTVRSEKWEVESKKENLPTLHSPLFTLHSPLSTLHSPLSTLHFH